MQEIRDAIKHICESIQDGGQDWGWKPAEMRELTASVLQMAEADAKLNPREEMSVNEAFKTIFMYCRLYDRCSECPKVNVCKTDAPSMWDISEIGGPVE